MCCACSSIKMDGKGSNVGFDHSLMSVVAGRA
jgi:hypothetical protein